MKRDIPHNAYTNSPEQNPNLILGSFHLLFWVMFRPSVWKGHLRCLRQSQERTSKEARKFEIQAFIVMPVSTSIIIGFFSIVLGVAPSSVFYCAVAGIVFGVAGSWILKQVFDEAVGMLYGIAFSATFGLAHYAYSVSSAAFIVTYYGAIFGAAYGITATPVASGITAIYVSVALVLAVSATYSLSYGINYGIAIGLASGLTVGLAISINWWRPIIMSSLLVPWHFILYQMDKASGEAPSSRLHAHIAFWDDRQRLHIWGLDKHLLLVLDKHPKEGRIALNYLSTSSQRWAAQIAQIEVDIRLLQQCTSIEAIGQIHSRLAVGGSLQDSTNQIFRNFNLVSRDVNATLRRSTTAARKPALTSIRNKLGGLIIDLNRSKNQHAAQFLSIARLWQKIIDVFISEIVREAFLLQEIDSPYVIGVPLTENQEVFVGRIYFSSRIEQLLIDRRRPPLLLYGQRRTGKTSLLNNLGRLLPSNIIPLFVDLQGPVASSADHASFLYNLARGMIEAAARERNITFPTLYRDILVHDPFARFYDWIRKVESRVEEKSNTEILLALDEFETLNYAFSEGRLKESDVLGMFRNLIQHHPKFKILLAGSHTLDEFTQWSSYLINAQVLHLGCLTENEARRLIEIPCNDFALRYEKEASQRVIEITKCHPYLVQSLCAEIITIKNEQEPLVRRLATLSDVEAAVPEALSSGSMFFNEIEHNQLNPPSLKILRYIASRGESAIVARSELERKFSEAFEEACFLLIKREIIEERQNGFQIRIELIRRWFSSHRR